MYSIYSECIHYSVLFCCSFNVILCRNVQIVYRGIEFKVEHTVNVYSLFSAVAVLMLYYAEMFK